MAACPYEAIDLEMKPETIEMEVQAVIWATGWQPYDAAKIDGLGFGTYPNVITNVMMERSGGTRRTDGREDTKAIGREGNRERGLCAMRRVAR